MEEALRRSKELESLRLSKSRSSSSETYDHKLFRIDKAKHILNKVFLK